MMINYFKLIVITLILLIVSQNLSSQCLFVSQAVNQEGNVVLIGYSLLNEPYSYTLSINSNTEEIITLTPEIVNLGGDVNLLIFEIDLSCNPIFTITNMFGQECTYVNGQLCEECPPASQWESLIDCDLIDPGCGVHLINFLLENQEEIFNSNTNQVVWEGYDVHQGDIFTMDKVSVGTNKNAQFLGPANSPFFTFGLTVADGLITDKLHVFADTWPDFVFDKDYDLMSFYDLNKFLEHNNRLRHFPSSKEIASSGYDVYEIKKLQQLSIEELFLYLIQLEEELINLEKEVQK